MTQEPTDGVRLQKVLAQAGVASRRASEELIAAGRVEINGKVVTEQGMRVDPERDTIRVDGSRIPPPRRHLYLVLNKPRGLVTTANDEQGRDTVYRCFDGADFGHVAPVGRLDKASEGLLLFSNDPAWAARITDPATGPDKTYHVQVDCIPQPSQLQAMRDGIAFDGLTLRTKAVSLLRAGEKHAWLEIVLDEGRNRQIRRLLEALDIGVLRLLRVAIGPLRLGGLSKGRWRELTTEEIAALGGD